MKRWVLMMLLLSLCLGLCACGGDQRVNTSQSADTTAAPSQPTDSPATPEVTATPEPKAGYGIGERAELKDVAATLTKVEESEGSQFFAPEEGKTFLLCYFDIENNSDEDLAISSLLCFDAYVDDYSVSLSLSATIAADASQLDGTVAAGKKMAGVIGYEVDTDWSELEITFNPNVWSSKGITFTAQHP